MDRYIVYDKQLSKADVLILKNLEADIKDAAAKPKTDGDSVAQDGNVQSTLHIFHANAHSFSQAQRGM